MGVLTSNSHLRFFKKHRQTKKIEKKRKKSKSKKDSFEHSKLSFCFFPLRFAILISNYDHYVANALRPRTMREERFGVAFVLTTGVKQLAKDVARVSRRSLWIDLIFQFL